MTCNKQLAHGTSKSELVASIKFLQAHPQTIHTLCNLLRHICDVSPDYDLSEQCFWFCDTIMTIVHEQLGGSRFIRGEAWSKAGKYSRISVLGPGRDTMEQIRARFLASKVDAEPAEGMFYPCSWEATTCTHSPLGPHI